MVGNYQIVMVGDHIWMNSSSGEILSRIVKVPTEPVIILKSSNTHISAICHYTSMFNKKLQTTKTRFVQKEELLYGQVPTIGIEGLIATIEDEKKLLKALEKEVLYKQKTDIILAEGGG